MHSAAVSIYGRQAHQGGDLFPVQSAQVSLVNYICRFTLISFAGCPLLLAALVRWWAALVGRVGAVAWDVEFQDDGVMHHPVNRSGGGHGIGKDALPLREHQV